MVKDLALWIELPKLILQGKVRLGLLSASEHLTIDLKKIESSPDAALDFRTITNVVLFVKDKEDEI
jgi:hypothetical protein